jgi:hypothetical protein
MDIRKISDTIYKGHDIHKKDLMDDVYYKMAEWVKENNKEWYDKFCDEAEEIVYAIDENKAKEIVMNMIPYGQRWSMEEIRNLMHSKGVMDKYICYYLVMNMTYNDFSRTARQYNLDIPEFYFDLSTDFINDPDAKKHKVQKYFLD